MCYLVAKDRYAHGCFALKTTHGKHLAELKRELNQADQQHMESMHRIILWIPNRNFRLL